jgi:hypothetical protein
VLKAGTTLWRIHFKGGNHPTTWKSFRYYGPTAARFDHHTAPKRVQQRGIFHAACGKDAIRTALAEVFQDTRLVDRFCHDPWLVAFKLNQSLSLLDTGANWPVRAGGNMAINSGSRIQSKKWSRKIYRQYTNVQGIWYPSSLTNQSCMALYEKAAQALPARPIFNRALSDPSLLTGLSRLAGRLNYAMK